MLNNDLKIRFNMFFEHGYLKNATKMVYKNKKHRIIEQNYNVRSSKLLFE